MNDVLTHIVVWLNVVLTPIVVWLNVAANALGRALDFIPFLPGWLSITLIAIVSGAVMIVAFKYTSNQRAIKRVRQEIRSNLLAVKLFHDNIRAGFKSLGRVLLAALKLLVFAVVPILAMLVPMTLLLGQLSLWYQARPLKKGEEAVITLKLTKDVSASTWPKAELASTDAVADTHGAVRVLSQQEICWNVRAEKDGLHLLAFHVDDRTIEKELAVGSGFLPVSTRRPDWNWALALLYPREAPFPPDSLVQSIEVEYPARSSWTSGTNAWVWYWFAVSLAAGFSLRGVFNVNL